MSATYNGVTFDVETDAGFTPRFIRKPVVDKRHYPYADKNTSAYGGREDGVVVLKVTVFSDADWALLEASADGTARTLSNPFGDSANFTNVKITDFRSVKRRSYAQEWEAEVEFTQATS